jgi:hypothetical protein
MTPRKPRALTHNHSISEEKAPSAEAIAQSERYRKLYHDHLKAEANLTDELGFDQVGLATISDPIISISYQHQLLSSSISPSLSASASATISYPISAILGFGSKGLINNL